MCQPTFWRSSCWPATRTLWSTATAPPRAWPERFDHHDRGDAYGDGRGRDTEHRRHHGHTRLRAERAPGSRPSCNARSPVQRLYGVRLPDAATRHCRNLVGLVQPSWRSAKRWNGAAPRTLDADLRHAETQLSRFPAVVTAVPQAEIAAQVINWVAFRLIKLTVDDIHLARTAGMALMPQIAGLVLMLATTCSNPSDRRALARSSIRQARHMARTKISGASICTDHAIDLQRRRFTIAVRVIDKVVA